MTLKDEINKEKDKQQLAKERFDGVEKYLWSAYAKRLAEIMHAKIKKVILENYSCSMNKLVEGRIFQEIKLCNCDDGYKGDIVVPEIRYNAKEEHNFTSDFYRAIEDIQPIGSSSYVTENLIYSEWKTYESSSDVYINIRFRDLLTVIKNKKKGIFKSIYEYQVIPNKIKLLFDELKRLADADDIKIEWKFRLGVKDAYEILFNQVVMSKENECMIQEDNADETVGRLICEYKYEVV